ncbi:hypothetical protein NL676_034689 [Syzygium grande]|nr:hypothetical protein NL676_034689 [Syzygium grande]
MILIGCTILVVLIKKLLNPSSMRIVLSPLGQLSVMLSFRSRKPGEGCRDGEVSIQLTGENHDDEEGETNLQVTGENRDEDEEG